mmetsp:Transcript_8901/g.6247  ORF Transcript_8901/g.6247 Transcript_8901/m.6247 type:complete len:108 (+) Transcript_8901:1234-1557(+)
MYSEFCNYLLQTIDQEYNTDKELSIEQQKQKEAMYQVLDLRFASESSETDVPKVVALLEKELVHPQNHIVKKRVLGILARVSDFQQVHDDAQAQENFFNGVMKIFGE